MVLDQNVELEVSRLPASEAFGFTDALSVARDSIEESRRQLRSFDDLQRPCSDGPIRLDSRKIALLAYRSATARVKKRFWTTTFVGSGFWTGLDTGALEANVRMMTGGRSVGVRRLFILSAPVDEELQRIHDERLLLLKALNQEGLSHFDMRIGNLCTNIQHLLSHGCEVNVVFDHDGADHHLPTELAVHPLDTEIAIYDDWRFDLFDGGLSGTIDGARAYTPLVKGFDAQLKGVVDYFEQLWSRSQPMSGFTARLEQHIADSSRRIDYDVTWLAQYDLGLPQEDEALKAEELSAVKLERVSQERWGHVRGHLDVGTCTGRFPLALRDAVVPDGSILGVDNDLDSIRFTRAKLHRLCPDDRRLEIQRHDFRVGDQPSDQSFDLVTCMMGTLCHFERESQTAQDYDDALQRALRKFAGLLTEDGTLFFSVWTQRACEELRLLSIYDEESCRRLAKRGAVGRSELERRLRAVGLRAFPPIPLQGRLELYRCERC